MHDAFTAWICSGGAKGGYHHGETGFKAAIDTVSVHDLHATILATAGLDHERRPFKPQGLDQRLTGVDHPKVVR